MLTSLYECLRKSQPVVGPIEFGLKERKIVACIDRQPLQGKNTVLDIEHARPVSSRNIHSLIRLTDPVNLSMNELSVCGYAYG